jgi:hypothetical protein
MLLFHLSFWAVFDLGFASGTTNLPYRFLQQIELYHSIISHEDSMKYSIKSWLNHGFFSHCSSAPVVELGSAQAEPRGSTSSEVETTNAVW